MPIDQMDNSHLINTIWYLDRNPNSGAGHKFNEALWDKAPNTYKRHPMLDTMINEANKRELSY